MVICSSVLKAFGLAAKPFMKKSGCSDYEIKTVFAKLHNLVNIMATKNNDFVGLFCYVAASLVCDTVFANSNNF